MRHFTIAEKSFLVGDELADVLLRYTAHVGRVGSADDVSVRAIGVDGAEVSVQLVLNSGTILAAESTDSALPEPDNVDVVAYMLERMAPFEMPRAGDLQG